MRRDRIFSNTENYVPRTRNFFSAIASITAPPVSDFTFTVDTTKTSMESGWTLTRVQMEAEGWF